MKKNILSIAIGIALSIPLAIATVKAHEPKPDPTVRAYNPTEAEIQTETFTVEEILQEVVKVPETATECATVPSFEGYDFIPLEKGLQIAIYNLCEEYQISFELVVAVIATESGFNVEAVGDSGNAIGLMQIQPRWWQEKADAEGLDINEPLDNVEIGIIILVDALESNEGELMKALKQYNSGNPNFPSDAYVTKVINNTQWFVEQEEMAEGI